jgi:hypothetical protein
MIKKLLLVIIPCMLVLTLHAQNAGDESIVFKSYTPAQKMKPSYVEPIPDLAARSHYTGRKGTATGGGRWFLPYDLADKVYLGNTLTSNDYVFYIDWDSTLKQQFKDPGSGQYFYGAVNWLAIAQFVDPIYSAGFNDLTSGYISTSDIKVLGGFPYTVDSIFFPAAYMKGITGGSQNTVDTLYLSVAPVTYDSIHTYTPADTPTAKYSKVTNYDEVANNGNALKIMRLGPTDSLNRQLGNTGAVKWKIPLDTSLRKPKDINGNYPIHNYVLPVPGKLSVPAGWGFAISVAFKPGESWNAGDSVEQHHYFMPITSFNSTGQRMPYFYYTYNDRSMSYLMHDAAINRFSDAVRLEMFNDDNFNHEFINLGGFVSCAQCWDLNVAGGNKNLLNAKAYPNPANNELNIPVTLMNAADVHVSLTNAMGQVVASQTVKNITSGKAVFNTASLCSGIYFYTVEAGGERKTGRVTVAH